VGLEAIAQMSEDELRAFLLDQLTESRRARFEEVLSYRTRHLTVVLENLLQPHNASAILRNCDCFGIQDVHIIENDKVFNPAEEIARGAQKWVTQKRYNKLNNNTGVCIQALRADGYRIVAATPHANDIEISDLNLDDRTAIVFGSEWPGLSEEVMTEADQHIRIPMYGFTESFNVSVSVALTLYDLSRKLHSSNLSWNLSEKEKNDLRLEWAAESARSGIEILEAWKMAQK
jgi:tRNA (guanosine-2'-O-)-methyltransferase